MAAAEVVGIEVQVILGHSDGRVAQDASGVMQVDAVAHHEGGGEVAPGVGAVGVVGDVASEGEAVEGLADAGRGEGGAAGCGEEVGRSGGPEFQPAGQEIGCDGSIGHQALFAAFAGDAGEAAGGVEVGDGEVGGFGGATAGVGQPDEDRQITQVLDAVRRGDDVADACGDHSGEGFGGGGTFEAGGAAGAGNFEHDVGGEPVVAGGAGVEGAEDTIVGGDGGVGKAGAAEGAIVVEDGFGGGDAGAGVRGEATQDHAVLALAVRGGGEGGRGLQEFVHCHVNHVRFSDE